MVSVLVLVLVLVLTVTVSVLVLSLLSWSCYLETNAVEDTWQVRRRITLIDQLVDIHIIVNLHKKLADWAPNNKLELPVVGELQRSMYDRFLSIHEQLNLPAPEDVTQA